MSNNNSSLRTEISRVRYLGPNRATGTRHALLPRLTAAALMPLTILFAILIVSPVGRDYQSVVNLFAHRVGSGTIALLFVLVGIYHEDRHGDDHRGLCARSLEDRAAGRKHDVCGTDCDGDGAVHSQTGRRRLIEGYSNGKAMGLRTGRDLFHRRFGYPIIDHTLMSSSSAGRRGPARHRRLLAGGPAHRPASRRFSDTLAYGRRAGRRRRLARQYGRGQLEVAHVRHREGVGLARRPGRHRISVPQRAGAVWRARALGSPSRARPTARSTSARSAA